jgi:mycothiol system anti-sigma-R factor
MASCEKVLQEIWDYLDQEITPESCAEVKKHLDLCRSCFSRLEFQRHLREKMRDKTNHICPEKLKQRIQKLVDLY